MGRGGSAPTSPDEWASASSWSRKTAAGAVPSIMSSRSWKVRLRSIPGCVARRAHCATCPSPGIRGRSGTTPSGQRAAPAAVRGSVEDGLAGSDEPLGQQGAEPAGAFDRLSARFVPRGERQQPIASMPVSDQPELVDHGLAPIEHRGGVGALVRVDPEGEHIASSGSSSSAVAVAGQS
jgi:hypothetical protein